MVALTMGLEPWLELQLEMWDWSSESNRRLDEVIDAPKGPGSE